MAYRVSQDVLEVLDRAELDGPALRLTGQLDRKLYTAANKALELAGGKWNRSAKAHLFSIDAADAIEPIMLTGEITDSKSEFGAFYTPPEIAEQVIAEARLEMGMTVLEPSAGDGALAGLAWSNHCTVVCIEVRPGTAEALVTFGPAVTADFLTLSPERYGPFDRVIMNPPFAKQADARHVLHAAKFLKPGGRLVAIMAASVKFRDTPLYREVRELVASRGGMIRDLPEGAFKASGTSVNTVLVSFDAEAA